MLNSTKIAKVVELVQKEADIVLVAGSPVSWFAESLTLASQVNAVVLVARYGEVHSKVFTKVIENLHLMNIQLAGVIFDYNPSPFAFDDGNQKYFGVDTLRFASSFPEKDDEQDWKC